MAKDTNTHVNTPRHRGKRSRMIAFVILSVVAVSWSFPLIWIVLTSFKSEMEIITQHTILPARWTLDSYRDVFTNPIYATQMPILRWVGNSLFIAGTHTVLMLIVSSLSAYAYSRLEFKGRDFLFILQLSTLMIPAVIKIIPQYRIMIRLHWVDTPWAMIFPGLGTAGTLFLLRQFMMGIPHELDEAAMLDGASKFRIFFDIILPQCVPSLIVSGMFVFLANWNDFMWPVVITNSIEHRTLTSGLKVLQTSMFNQYAKLAVAAVVSALPMVILYFVAQRYFVRGLTVVPDQDS